MTFEEYSKSVIAPARLEEFKACVPVMVGHWHDDIDSYAPAVFRMIKLSAKLFNKKKGL